MGRGITSTREFVDSLDKDGVARWITLIYAEHVIATFCKDDEECITDKTAKLQDYIKCRFPDVKRYVDMVMDGEEVPPLDEYFVLDLED